MQIKRLKFTISILLVILIFIYSEISLATSENYSSNFTIVLYNSINLKKPLYYSVKIDGQDTVNGKIPAHNNPGETINVPAHSMKNGSIAEVVLTNSSGHMLWDGSVSFWGKESEFYTKTIYFDSHYIIGTNVLSKIHWISFVILPKDQ